MTTPRPKWRHDEPTEDDLPILLGRNALMRFSLTGPDDLAECARIGWYPLPTGHEPAPEPVERYTSEGCAHYEDGRWQGLANNPTIAERIALALNILDRQEREQAEADEPADRCPECLFLTGGHDVDCPFLSPKDPT